jgi:hypothetical protein
MANHPQHITATTALRLFYRVNKLAQEAGLFGTTEGFRGIR